MTNAQKIEDKTELAAFNEWFQITLSKTETCFERDVLRDCKEYLKVAWFFRAKEYDQREGS